MKKPENLNEEVLCRLYDKIVAQGNLASTNIKEMLNNTTSIPQHSDFTDELLANFEKLDKLQSLEETIGMFVYEYLDLREKSAENLMPTEEQESNWTSSNDPQ